MDHQICLIWRKQCWFGSTSFFLFAGYLYLFFSSQPWWEILLAVSGFAAAMFFQLLNL
jgi:hypothetical protein